MTIHPDIKRSIEKQLQNEHDLKDGTEQDKHYPIALELFIRWRMSESQSHFPNAVVAKAALEAAYAFRTETIKFYREQRHVPAE